MPAIADRLDRLPVTWLHAAIVAVATFGLFADIAEVALSNSFSAIFLAAPYHVSRAELSLLLGSVFAGGAIGAPLLGWLGDRYGRKVALQIGLLVLIFSSLAVAASRDVSTMTGFRFVTGLALGGYPPLSIAYLSDLMPPRRRGTLLMLFGALAYLGAPAVILLIRWLTPLAPLGIEGWRWALVFGAGCSMIVMLMFFLMPESPRWLASVGKIAKADLACRRFEMSAGVVPPSKPPTPQADVVKQSGFRALIDDPTSLRRTALLGCLFVLGPWAWIGFPLLSTAVMFQKGFHAGDSLLFAGLSMFGPTLGIAATAPFVDRIPRRLALVACAGVMIAAGVGFATGTDLVWLIAIGFVFNLTSAVYSSILSLYAAEILPTHLRASSTAGVWGLGRLVSAFVPVLLLPLLGSHGPIAMFAVISLVLLASLSLIVTAGPPGRERLPVE